MTDLSASKQPLWDSCVRLCHWAMVLLVGACWWTGENHDMVYHEYSGYGLLGVVLLRIFWGFYGSNTARFKHFLHAPHIVMNYLKDFLHRDYPRTAGHNPMGGYSVIAVLSIVLLQIGLGLFAIDVDGFDGGPFADYLSFDASRQMAELHGWVFNGLLGIIGLHIMAIIYYLIWRRQNLVVAMIHGKSAAADAQTLQAVSPWRLALGVVPVVILLVWLIRWAS